MNPADSAATAAWISAAVAALFGLTGFVVGVVGLVKANKANQAAASANLIAKDANSISKQANSLSEESNGIAREANEISNRTAERADEQHDVAWEWDFNVAPHEDRVTIRNIGKNQAFGVIAQFMFEDVTEANNAALDVEGRHAFQLEIPGLGQAFAEERASKAGHEQSQTYEMGRMGTMHVPLTPFFATPYRWRLRVSWRTASGAPKSFDSDWKVTHLPT